MRLLSLHRSFEAALTLHGENKTESSEGKATASVPERGFPLERQSCMTKHILVKPQRKITPIKIHSRAVDPPYECDGNFTPQSWQETSAVANGFNDNTGISVVCQWQRIRGGANGDWRVKDPTGGLQQVPVRHSRGKVGRFALSLFPTHWVSADTDLGSDLLACPS